MLGEVRGRGTVGLVSVNVKVQKFEIWETSQLLSVQDNLAAL